MKLYYNLLLSRVLYFNTILLFLSNSSFGKLSAITDPSQINSHMPIKGHRIHISYRYVFRPSFQKPVL